MTKRLAILCLLAGVSTATAGEPQAHQRIDKAIQARSGGALAPVASDAEFFRRVHLDLAGIIPTADETRKFLTDTDPNKRTRTIDSLLASDVFPRRMREVVTVWLLERRPGTVVADPDWNQFVEGAFAANQPWDAFVHDLISADGSDPKTRAAIRFFVDGGRSSHHQMTQDVARLFLGMNLQCAQCHNDPNVRDFEQAHYFGLFAYLQQSKLQTDKKKQPSLIETAAKDKMEFQSVFNSQKRTTGPKLPDRAEIDVPVMKPRQLLARDLTAVDHRRFVRSSVNRFWFLMMGRGLVHPLDLMHGKNPPSHPELLEQLADDFSARKFDVKYLLRQIALSESYQRSSLLPAGVDAKSVKPESYRAANPRGLSAEQLAWSLMRATGNLERIVAQPRPKDSKFTYKDYVNGKFPPPNNLSDVMNLFVASFGSPAGTPEVEFLPSASQALFLMNEKLLMHWLTARDNNLVDRLAKVADAAKLADDLYLTALTRLPDAEEKAMCATYLDRHQGRRTEAIAELAWALLTSAEFRLNH